MKDLLCAVSSLLLTRVRGYFWLLKKLDKLEKQVIPPEIYASKEKLNLGSSNRLIPTYINVDALEERKPDIVCDVSRLTFAPDNTYDLVRASHILEHFALEKISTVLSEWRRVLKPGGFLVLCVPNFRAIAWRVVLSTSGFNLSREVENGWIKGLFALDLPPEFRHQIVFDYDSLCTLLSNNGFKVFGRYNYRKEHPFTIGIEDDSCSIFSLNIVATKN